MQAKKNQFFFYNINMYTYTQLFLAVFTFKSPPKYASLGLTIFLVVRDART